MGHLERRQKEKGKIRKRIMDTALTIAKAKGWSAVTIRSIANAIEYTPPIVYEHFKNKNDLLEELRIMGHRTLYANYEATIRAEANPVKALMLISENHWDFAFQNQQLYQLMFNFSKPFIRNADIEKIIDLKKQLFFELTQDMDLAREMLFGWMCLLNGYIFNVMQMGIPPDIVIAPKVLFINAVKRFLSLI